MVALAMLKFVTLKLSLSISLALASNCASVIVKAVSSVALNVSVLFASITTASFTGAK
jgi:hypothetical protein